MSERDRVEDRLEPQGREGENRLADHARELARTGETPDILQPRVAAGLPEVEVTGKEERAAVSGFRDLSGGGAKEKETNPKFDTIGGEVNAAPEMPVVHATGGDGAPNDIKQAAWNESGGSGKGSEFLQQVGADNNDEKLKQLNKTSDAATAVNAATKGKYANNPFFNPSSGVLGLLTDFDVNPLTVAGWVKNSMASLDKVNDALTGKKPEEFHPITSNGKPCCIAMPQSMWDSYPKVELGLNGKNETIKMDLPDFKGHAVTLVTDGHRVLAIDPKNDDVWQLGEDKIPGIGYVYGHSWEKLPKKNK